MLRQATNSASPTAMNPAAVSYTYTCTQLPLHCCTWLQPHATVNLKKKSPTPSHSKDLVFWLTLFPLKIISFSTTNNIWGMGRRGRRLFLPGYAKVTDI